MTTKNKAKGKKSEKLALKREVLKRLGPTLDDAQLQAVAGGYTCTTGSLFPTN